jgi:hypothetical protein
MSFPWNKATFVSTNKKTCFWKNLHITNFLIQLYLEGWKYITLCLQVLKPLKPGCQMQNLLGLLIQAALVLRGLFICELTFSHCKNGPKWEFFSQKWAFYLRIQGSRSKMMERIYEGYLFTKYTIRPLFREHIFHNENILVL